jgi:hypothetical protein
MKKYTIKNTEKLFKCPDCNNFYKTIGSRTRHYNSKHRMMGHNCVQCNKWFVRKYRLKIHLLKHMKTDNQSQGVSNQYNTLFPVCKKKPIKRETTLILTVTIPSTGVVDQVTAAKILISFCTHS